MLQGTCHLPHGTEPVLSETCGRAALALGFCDGPLTCEIVVHQDVAHVVEISPRLDGPLFLAAATKMALGEKPSPDDLRG
jgi:hypothetical protein